MDAPCAATPTKLDLPHGARAVLVAASNNCTFVGTEGGDGDGDGDDDAFFSPAAAPAGTAAARGGAPTAAAAPPVAMAPPTEAQRQKLSELMVRLAAAEARVTTEALQRCQGGSDAAVERRLRALFARLAGVEARLAAR